MIEHMFDETTVPTAHVSFIEQAFSEWFRSLPGAPVFIIEGPPHGRRTTVEQPSADLRDEGLFTGSSEVLDEAPAGPVAGIPTELPDELPAGLGVLRRLLDCGADELAAAKAAYLESGRLAAVQARRLAAFAAQRPAAALDRPDEEVGAAAAASRAARPRVLTAVSEWAADEVAAAFALSGPAAATLLTESVILAEQLPGTLAALEAGVIGWAHARMLTEVLSLLTDPAVRTGVEEKLLSRAAGRTVSQLRESARRAVLRADASVAARRLATAIRDRQVRVFPGRDGMASLSATLPIPVALACRSALERFAEACRTPDDVRTKDQRVVDCLADLILRPGETGLPPVQAQLQIVATAATLTGGDEPGEIDGEVVPAAVVRELAYALGLMPRSEASDLPVADVPPAGATSVETTTGAPTPTETATGAVGEANAVGNPVSDSASRSTDAPNASAAGAPSASERAAADLAALLGIRTVAGTALAHLPTIAVVEEIGGQLLALTHAGELRRCATVGTGLGPPPATAGYSPAAALDRFVRARDRRCRFPGCRARAQRCDLDHNTPWPAGPTSADNLCCLCRHHHRLSHQAPAGACAAWPTAACNGPPPAARRSPPTHPGTPPTTPNHRRPHPHDRQRAHHAGPSHHLPPPNASSADHDHPAPTTTTQHPSDERRFTRPHGSAGHGATAKASPRRPAR